MGILNVLLGGAFGIEPRNFMTQQPMETHSVDSTVQRQGYYNFTDMANQRLGNGLEPIDWPKIISNQFRALALTRPLTVLEQFAHDEALQALNEPNK